MLADLPAAPNLPHRNHLVKTTRLTISRLPIGWLTMVGGALAG
jgi:hypothetical protein